MWNKKKNSVKVPPNPSGALPPENLAVLLIESYQFLPSVCSI